MPGAVFYTIGIGFASGIVFRSLFDIGAEVMWTFVVVGVALVLLWRQKSAGFLSHPKAPSLFLSETFTSPLFIAGIFSLACALGVFRMEYAERLVSPLSAHLGEEVEFTGKVVREPEARAQNIHLHIAPRVGDEFVKPYVLVSIDRFTHDTFSYGDVVSVEGKLTLPEPFETDGGRQFDYPGYLRAKSIDTVVYYADVSRESEGEPSILRSMYAFKKQFVEGLEHALPHPHAGLGEGVLLGVKRALGEDLEEAFRKTGIIHIVVLSGYNVLIVVEAMMFILAYFCRPKMRLVIGLTWIVSFAFLVGLSATVVRACIMASLLLIARATGRTYAILRALMLAGVLMLILNPYLLVYDTGFQLSFLATLGLLLFSPYVEKRLTYVPQTCALRSIVSATIATQIIVLPILLYHTGMLSLVSIVVNALVLPVVPLAMLLTFLTGVLSFVSASLANGVGFLAYGVLNYIVLLAEWFGSLSFSAKIIQAFPFWIVLVSYGVIGMWYFMKVRDDAPYVPGEVVSNDYEGWVIEEEKEKTVEGGVTKEKTPEALRASGASKDSLPFR